jgi:hypothetical protein
MKSVIPTVCTCIYINYIAVYIRCRFVSVCVYTYIYRENTTCIIVLVSMEPLQCQLKELLCFISEDCTFKLCTQIVTSTILAHGIKVRIKGRQISPSFQRFVNDHYVPFVQAAIVYVYSCGFVPWRLSRLQNNQVQPDLIPMGSFLWGRIIATNEKNSRKRSRTSETLTLYDRQQRALKKFHKLCCTYDIQFITNMPYTEDDVELFEVFPTAIYDQSKLSTPLGVIPRDYYDIRQAKYRLDYADNWNMRARLINSYVPMKDMYKLNESSVMFSDCFRPESDAADTNLSTDIQINAYTRDAITRDLCASVDASHVPVTYTLPQNTSLQATQHLQPAQNVDNMIYNLAESVCSVFGIHSPVDSVNNTQQKQNCTTRLDNLNLKTSSFIVYIHINIHIYIYI